ncbi:LVIVD repeat-containing protein [Parapedobacter sp. 2B3]|uniref:LVIVD repeat-containing protein n=1 Tax=Parapedobacter sp. 2B3 TaxID=3342381 RepID=UPI0035B5A38D
MERKSLFGRLSNSWMGLLLAVVAVLFASCRDQVEHSVTYKTQVPVYIEVSAFRSMDVGIKPPKSVSETGKIYVYGDYLFINEPQKGIHIVDNRNPSDPKNINFISVPGNVDMAVNSNILYADSYIDLLAFDISNIRDVKLVERVEAVFPNMFVNAERSTFMTYKDTVITAVTTEEGRIWGGVWLNEMAFASGDFSGPSYGQGGSMARFTLMGGHLYAVDNQSLRLFDVHQANKPEFVKDIPLGWGIETIFPYKQKLFIGSLTGMHIYDASTPSAPEPMAVYQHVMACDPVVVNDDYAFVTLRSGTTCRMSENVLEVLDIKDLYHPKLLKSYPMDNPHGLGLRGNNLYICEGDYGLKSFDATDVMHIGENLLEHHKDRSAIDVIPAPKSLIVTGPDGVCQYDYSDPARLRLLSRIHTK